MHYYWQCSDETLLKAVWLLTALPTTDDRRELWAEAVAWRRRRTTGLQVAISEPSEWRKERECTILVKALPRGFIRPGARRWLCGGDRTLTEIGAPFNITRERVRQIYRKGLTKVLDYMESPEFQVWWDQRHPPVPVIVNDAAEHLDSVVDLEEQKRESDRWKMVIRGFRYRGWRRRRDGTEGTGRRSDATDRNDRGLPARAGPR